MLLRKVANHPLLLRARYTDAAALAAAKIVWDLSNDREPQVPDAAALGFTGSSSGSNENSDVGAGAGGGRKGGKRGGSSTQPTLRLCDGSLHSVTAADAAACSDGNSSGDSSSLTDVMRSVLMGDNSSSSSGASSSSGDAASFSSSSSSGADKNESIGNSVQVLLRSLASAHTPPGREELLRWARENVGEIEGATPVVMPSATSAAVTSSSSSNPYKRGASSSGGAGGAAALTPSQKAWEKAVKALADMAEGYLGSSVSGLTDSLAALHTY